MGHARLGSSRCSASQRVRSACRTRCSRAAERVAVGATPGSSRRRWTPAREQPPERLPLSVGGRNLGLLRAPSGTTSAHPAGEPGDAGVLRSVRTRARARSAAPRRHRGGGLPADGRGAPIAAGGRLPRSAEPARRDQGIGDGPARGGRDKTPARTRGGAGEHRQRDGSARRADHEPPGHVAHRGRRAEAADPGGRSRGGHLVMRRPHPAAVARPAVRRPSRGDPAIVRADPVFLDRVVDEPAGQRGEDRAEQREARRSRSRRGAPTSAVTVRIIDHGDGVPATVREQLFYPFYQVTERHPRLGTGLGLADRQGVPRADGRGDLDRGDTGRRGDVRVLAPDERRHDVMKKARVLVVDDEEQIRQAVGRALTGRGLRGGGGARRRGALSNGAAFAARARRARSEPARDRRSGGLPRDP